MNIPLPLRAFLFGTLAASGALLAELIFLSSRTVFFEPLTIPSSALPRIGILSLLFLAGAEEASKLILLKKAFQKNSSITVTHLLSFGLGFAFVEAMLLMTHSFPLDTAPDILSSLSIVALHCATVLFLGCFCLNQARIVSCLTGFFLVLAIHFAYNLSILYQASLLATTTLAFASLAMALLKMKFSLP